MGSKPGKIGGSISTVRVIQDVLEGNISLKDVAQLILAEIEVRAKGGIIYTSKYGLERSIALEAFRVGEYSGDIGFTPSQLYGGLSRKISDNIDISGGLATDFRDVTPYIGVHFRF